jgi:hypothetical protein
MDEISLYAMLGNEKELDTQTGVGVSSQLPNLTIRNSVILNIYWITCDR